MIITKKEAKEKGIDNNHICTFHENNPDQRAVQDGVCPNCIYIQDPCGCGLDEGCRYCDEDLRGEKMVRTTLRSFKNIIGKKINVLCKPMQPNEIKEFEVPNATVGRQDLQLWIVSRRQEISNLLEQKYIEEVENGLRQDDTKKTIQEETRLLREYGLLSPV